MPDDGIDAHDTAIVKTTRGQCGRVTSSTRNPHTSIFLSCVVYFYLACFHIVDQLFNLFVDCTVVFCSPHVKYCFLGLRADSTAVDGKDGTGFHF